MDTCLQRAAKPAACTAYTVSLQCKEDASQLEAVAK
eukprot:IDg12659t1